MKNKLILVYSLIISLLFTACGKNIASNNAEMLNIIKETKNDTRDIKECGTITIGDKLLMLGLSGDNEYNYSYYAGEFLIIEDNKYEFERTIPLYNIGWQIYTKMWENGNILFCNNSDAVKVQIIIKEIGNETYTITEEINEIPWIYYHDISDIHNDNIEYKFLDANNKEII